MYYSLAQIIVIARGNDSELWKILIFVIMAAVYGLGALIKAKGKKTEDQAQEQQTGKPQRKPSAGGRGILEQFFREIQQVAEGKLTPETRPSDQTARQQTARPQAAVRKYATEAKQAKRVQPTAPAKPKLSKPTPQVQTDFEKLSELDTVTQPLTEYTTNVAGLAGKHKDLPAEVAGSRHLSEVLSDYEDPDELKRAILHYEILGKPLALRDPSRVIIGL